MTPVVSIRKTLSVELEPFIKEMLKPHFHSGGGPKKVGNNPVKLNEVPSWFSELVIPATFQKR